MARAKEMGIIVTDAEGKEKVNALLPLLFEPDKKGQPIQYVSLDGKRQWFSIPRNEDVGSDRYGQFKTGVVVQLDDLGPGRHRAGFSAVIAAEPFRKDGKLLLPLLADSSDSDGRPMLFYWAMEEDGFPNWLGVFEVRGGNWWSPEGIVAHATPNSRGRYVTQEWSLTDPTKVLDVFKPGVQLVMDVVGGDYVDVSACDAAPKPEVCVPMIELYNRYRLVNEELIEGKRGLDNGTIIHFSNNMAVAVPGE